MKSRHHCNHNARLYALLALALMVLAMLLSPTQVQAQSLRQHCLERCGLNLMLCTQSSLPSLTGRAPVSACVTDCGQKREECVSKCTGTNAAKCRNACDVVDATCHRSCSQGQAQCNDTFLSCNRTCEARPECTLDSMCAGGACIAGRCEAGCASDQQCRQRLNSNDAVCMAPAGRARRCVVI